MSTTVTGTLALSSGSSLADGTFGMPTWSYTFSNANPQRISLVLASGENTILIPSSPFTPQAMWLEPPSANSNAVSAYCVSGDHTAGIPLSLTQPAFIPVNGISALYLYSAGAATYTLIWL